MSKTRKLADNFNKFIVLRGKIMELIEAIGCKDNQKKTEVIDLSVAVVNDAAMFLEVSQNGLAILLGVNDTKTVRAWFSGKDTPRKSALLLLQQRLKEVILPPDSLNAETGVRRCFDALCIILDDLETKAAVVGWEVQEIRDAVREWVQEKRV